VATSVSGDEDVTHVALHLQDLVLESPGVEPFLQKLAAYSAAHLGHAARLSNSARLSNASRLSTSEGLSNPGRVGRSGGELFCGISLRRRKKAITTASSSPRASVWDQMQGKCGEGPTLTAMREGKTVLVPDLRLEERWPDYVHAVTGLASVSVLAVPLALDGSTRAALTLYAEHPPAFSGDAIAAAEAFAGQASKGLQLALRMSQLQDTRDEMRAAMKSRTVIDLATGAIMARNRCSQDAAFKVLLQASSTRNIKLRDVAARVVSSISGSAPTSTHFDE
jgi:hypothetical protein